MRRRGKPNERRPDGHGPGQNYQVSTVGKNTCPREPPPFFLHGPSTQRMCADSPYTVFQTMSDMEL